MSVKSRYSDQELKEFQKKIERKLANANEDHNYVQDQLADLAENKEAEGDWMDSNTNSMEMEMLQTMAYRQQHHIQYLKNALIRIHNKSYGICIVTGKLIDKRRLMAVPTTTKSLSAKSAVHLPKERKVVKSEPSKRRPEIITRVIRKKVAITSANPPPPEEDEMPFEDFYPEDFDNMETGTLDGDNMSDY